MQGNSTPDRFEKGVRFGCGFAAGGLLAILTVIGLAMSTGLFWGIVVGAAVVFGLLAVRYGDEFWERLSELMKWGT